ncbi:uncharacterized protein N7496_004090 [Penicillium cataractarum]|uniref:DUF8035 domain-containing protein n=1 Tax=Penicillium cataractarum TaxID=2100454 RepID=A0A9W9SNR0_9EURO|nr:uncharacterized protein N7496_004090 [Penicillium cataractarum]KAJ5381662.1 hypothetical protein N7496_004090 [Penicillium cataractarum]
MGFSSHFRGLSPTGGRHNAPGPRASTGMVQLGSSLDTYEPPRSRHDYDDYYYPSDVGYTSTYRHHPRHRSTIDVQPVSTQKYREHGHSTKKRTEYAIQPQTRHRSHTASATDIYDIPGRPAVPSSSSSHLRPVHGSGHDHRTPSPIYAEPSRQMVPTSSSRHGSGHRRVFSTDYASDTGRLEMRDSARYRPGAHHGAHRVQPPAGRRRHPPYEGPKKGYDIDNYAAYSYTGPGEEARRDLSGDYPIARPRQPSGRSSMDRPMSLNIAEHHPQWPARSKEPRSHGPPPTSWALDKIDRDGRPRTSARGFDEYRDTSRTRAPAGHERALVPMPHESDDDYYSDAHRRSRREDPRRHVDDRSPRPHNGGNDRSLAVAGLGTAALASGFSDASDYEHHRPGRRRHRRREAERDYDSAQPSTRDVAESGPSNSERPRQLTLEAGKTYRRRGHSRRNSRRSESDTEVYTDDEDLHKYRREPAAAPHRSRHSSTDTSSAEDRSARRPPRDRSHHRSRSRRAPEDGRSSESRSSPTIDRREEARKPIAVEPPATKEAEQPAPRGILKPPKKAFPEEPNPIREGVAPLKDANKNGIPPTARWTKIDRRLVNPAALEAGNERYEERSEFVIVLRVLTKEEIQAYALKTQEIRGKLFPFDAAATLDGTENLLDVSSDARREEYVRDTRQRREEDQRHGRRGEESSSDDEDESEDEPLKIEAPPVPDVNTSLPMRSRHSPPLPERPPAVQA